VSGDRVTAAFSIVPGSGPTVGPLLRACLG